jgi:hypothetical protein
MDVMKRARVLDDSVLPPPSMENNNGIFLAEPASGQQVLLKVYRYVI